MKTEHRRESRTVTTQGGDTEALREPKPIQKVSDLRQGRARNGMTLLATPRAINRPPVLIQSARRWTARQGGLDRYRRRETSRTCEALESLQA